jgi:hypothetical protein
MPKTPKKDRLVYQLKVTLKDSRPPIWRRILVDQDASLGDLHLILQIAMGWEEAHLHQFVIDRVCYGTPDPEFEFDVEDEWEITLSQVVTKAKQKFVYEYDFGDGWDHDIEVEKISPPDPEIRYPVCSAGKRACPPEDCGGIWGYESLLKVIGDPKHPEHEEMLEWTGEDFDPEFFDIESVNKRLRSLR